MAKTAEAIANETKDKTQEYVSKSIIGSEKAVESMIEFNAAMFRGAEMLTKRAYDNYVTNIAAAFEGMKSVNKSNDMGEFFKTSTGVVASAAERMAEQTKNYSELSGRVAKDTGEAGRQAFAKVYAA